MDPVTPPYVSMERPFDALRSDGWTPTALDPGVYVMTHEGEPYPVTVTNEPPANVCDLAEGEWDQA